MPVAVLSPPRALHPVPAVPGWALPRGEVCDLDEAAFMAGAALNSLDSLVQAAPPWGGVWRQRLALSGAAAAVRRVGRTEDEAALRDAWYLRAPGDDPGPAGRVLAAWRRLADRAPAGDAEALLSVAGLLGIGGSAGLADVPGRIADLVRSGRPAPFIAAAVMAQVHAARPDADLLAWWLADQALALRMRWPFPVPLLVGQAQSALFRGTGRGGRLLPGDAGFQKALCLALTQSAAAACRLAAEIAPRADRLAAVAPKLRAKGAGEALRRLMDDDAVPGTLQTEQLSRWATRRLFERLTALEAVRELSGRPAFRLYGL